MTTNNQIASHLLRSRIGKICVAITGSTPQEMIERANQVVRETNFVEFRLDYLAKPLAAMPAFKAFLAENTAATAIATCRCKPNGGRFTGSTSDAAEILLKAAAAGFQIIDVELESAEKLPKATLQSLRDSGAALLISFHDFTATKDLDGVFLRMKKFSPDFYKIVPTAVKLTDNLTLMRFVERVADEVSVIGLCMGDPGIASRVLSLRAGSAFIFAAASVGEETGPGQIAARTLIETYRVDQVDAATKVYGVAGNPIKNSLSPLMMNTAFRRETVNAVYLALQTSKVDDLFKLAKEIPIQGLSITMPLKQDILPLLERSDPLSRKIGAVNTVLRAQDGKFYGFNTDVAGIIAPLERRINLNGAKVLVLGAGGAARAAVFGLRDKGAEVYILNRTTETAQKLARQAGAKTIKRDAVAKSAFDVIINATPVGMTGNKTPPLLGAEDLLCKLVFDLVYNPLDTPLLRTARQKGISVITGIEMFVQQGARQFEIWTGKPAPEEEMLRVVLHSLRQAAQATGEEPAPLPTVQRVETHAATAAHAQAQAAAHAQLQARNAAAAAEAAAAAAKAAAAAPVKVVKQPSAKAVAAAAKVAAPAPAKAVPAKPEPKPVASKKAVVTKIAPAKKIAKPIAKKKPATKQVVAKKASKSKPAPAKKASAKPTKKLTAKKSASQKPMAKKTSAKSKPSSKRR